MAAEQQDRQAAVVLQANQARLDRFVAVAPWIWVLVSIVILVVNWASTSYFRDLWHWWHAVIQTGAGQTVPPLPHRPLWTYLVSLLSLVILPVEIVFLVWQYRAAQVARALRYPALHSPGWGVGCWFVPVVNLWMPYQALRDCLPPGHPARRYVLYTWITYLSVSVLSSLTLVVLVGAPHIGIALVFITLAAQLAFGLNSQRTAQAIAADHRDALPAMHPMA